MRVPDTKLDELHELGYFVLEGFLTSEELTAARRGLWLEFPKPEQYFDDPAAFDELRGDQFAGLRLGPWASWDLNRLAFHPDLVDLAERFLGSADLRLYKMELWAKYAGAVDYDQVQHRDFGNHSLVVPQRSARPSQMTSFIFLSDVGEDDGPTKVVPLEVGDAIAMWPNRLTPGELSARERSVTGPAGSLFTYRTDVLHRGSQMTGAAASRFVLLADYEVWGPRWTGKMAWPDRALSSRWVDMIERATPRQRELFGFPAPGDPYWDPQTLHDVQSRYPAMNMIPYR